MAGELVDSWVGALLGGQQAAGRDEATGAAPQVSKAGGDWNAQLSAFMESVAAMESGGRYHVVGPETPNLGRALGKYQIMEDNWPRWAAEAGIPDADWRNPAAQEHVARYKFTQYWQQFDHRWDAVAVAWFAGPGNASRFLANPSSVGATSDILGTTVVGYVRNVVDGMDRRLGRAEQTAAQGGPPPGHPAATGRRLLDPETTSARFPAEVEQVEAPGDRRQLPLQRRARDVVTGFEQLLRGGPAERGEPATVGADVDEPAADGDEGR